MIWIAYNILFSVAFVLLLPNFLRRMLRRGGYRNGFMERFGCYPAETRAKLAAGRRIWIHAVSVGEVMVAARFMHSLRERSAGAAFVLTTTTSTGRAVAARLMGRDDVLLYFPVDFPVVAARVLRALKPAALLLTECELWPNLIRKAVAAGVPVVLINGRISDSSYRGYRRVAVFARRILGMMDLLLVQTAEDAARLVALGADAGRVKVVGTAKYDTAGGGGATGADARSFLAACGVGEGDPVLLGGSTWDGEELALVRAFKALRAEQPRLRLVLVPRHAERAGDVERVIAAEGLRCLRRSGTAAADPGAVILVDTTGELSSFYREASVVFVGKSLTQHGGQNVIEPALLGKAVVTGPNMENFAEVMEDLRAADAVVTVADESGLGVQLGRLLADEALREGYGRRAREVVAAKQGSVRRSIELIEARFPGLSGA